MEKITVVIPNYNGMVYLPGCLESLRKEYQKASVSYEVLVIDNGSTDGSVEYLKKNSWVRSIFLDENTGFCHAVNLGIKSSRAPFVILLNNDTKARKGFVQALYDSIKDRKFCFSVSAQMLTWDDDTVIDDAGDLYCVLGWSRARGKGKNAYGYRRGCRIFSACGGAAIYRKSVFNEIGYFDELHFAYLEDLDIGYRAKLFGYYNRYEPKAKVIHYGSATTGSRYNERKAELSAENNVYVIVKNMPGWQIGLNIIPFFIGFMAKFAFYVKRRMGRAYMRGFWKGWRKAFSREGRRKWVRHGSEQLINILNIELELWINLLFVLRDGN